MKFGIYCIIIGLVFISSCALEPSSCGASTQNIAGSIESTSWTAGEGSAKTITEDGVEKFDIIIFESGASISDLCTETNTDRTITTTVAQEVANYQLKLDLDNTDNNQTVTVHGTGIAFDLVTVGCLEVLSIGSTSIELRMTLQGSGVDMDGTVSISLCD